MGDYTDANITLIESVSEPSYRQCLDWLQEGSIADAPATFDYWARGNFTRHVIYNRQKESQPLVIAAENVEQMRWAYRRVALLGRPVDFIYTGQITEPQKLLHGVPLEPESVFDCGWGYIGSITDVGDSQALMLIGNARLMPEEVLQWLIREMPRAFQRGEVFVAPNELIGISKPSLNMETGAFSDICMATPVLGSEAAPDALFNIDIPFIDGMSSADFERFLEHEAPALEEFRSAFISLLKAESETSGSVKDAIERVKYEVDEMSKSARHQRMRTFIKRCHGSIKTFEAAMGALAAAGAVAASDPFAGAAVAAGAGKVFRDLWKESKETTPDLSKHRLRLLWKLGSAKAPDIKSRKPSPITRAKFSPGNKIDPHHWLCPPTAGIQLAFVQKEEL